MLQKIFVKVNYVTTIAKNAVRPRFVLIRLAHDRPLPRTIHLPVAGDSSPKCRSFLGTVLRFFTFEALIAYLSYRISVLLLYEDYKITHAYEEDHYGIFLEFSQDDGFRVSARL